MDLARLREDEDSPDDQYAKPAKQGGMKIVTSMPAFLDHMAEEDANGGTSAAFRHQASVQEQSVDLRPLMLNGMSSGMQACDESAVVVFANVPSKGAFLEFVLQGTCDLMDPCWSMPFRQTKLPQGMYTFHFLVGGTRMLSSSYPVMGDKNVAIFSDSFRRYIVGHGSGTTASEVLESSPDGSPRQRLNSFNLATPPKETGMKRRVASYSQGLNSQAENMADVAGSQVASLTKILQDKRTPTALFSEKVFAGLYDNELPLRLHPSLLRNLDWTWGGSEKDVQLWAGSARVGKQHGQCEDACFVSNSAVGVADGVGGMSAFASYGVNSATMALELMDASRSACAALQQNCPDLPAAQCALQAIHIAERKAQSFGASTISVGVLRGNLLGVANLGDSGFMVLRRAKQRLEIVARSTEQHHRWNCPFQLTRLPPALSAKFPGFACDTPNDADKYTIPVQEGDLLLFFTDGLRDNLHDREIRHVTECALPPGVSQLVGLPEYKTAPESIAKALALAAFERSVDHKAMVPFAKACRKSGYDYEGGKEDDITVVAAWVVQDEPLFHSESCLP